MNTAHDVCVLCLCDAACVHVPEEVPLEGPADAVDDAAMDVEDLAALTRASIEVRVVVMSLLPPAGERCRCVLRARDPCRWH